MAASALLALDAAISAQGHLLCPPTQKCRKWGAMSRGLKVGSVATSCLGWWLPLEQSSLPQTFDLGFLFVEPLSELRGPFLLCQGARQEHAGVPPSTPAWDSKEGSSWELALDFCPWGVLSHFSHGRLCAALWAVVHQAPLSMGFPRQEYRSGLPCPSLGDLPNPGIEPSSPMSPVLAGSFFTTSTTWGVLGAVKGHCF